MPRHLAMIAKRTTGTADFAHPAWAVYVGGSTIPCLRIDCVPGPFGWELVALAGRYGVSYDDREAAEVIQRGVRRDMTLHEVLAVVRGVYEAQYRMHAEEAAAELETERRAEAFWENRMSDEDKAREDWEYGMFGA